MTLFAYKCIYLSFYVLWCKFLGVGSIPFEETITAEQFYGSLLERVDTILASIGAKDIGCRERAVCALYSDPFKHSPYSNLVSNELSKDSSELVPPAESKMALRYFRYVQAARDGQESKDCLSIYPQCNIDYGKK